MSDSDIERLLDDLIEKQSALIQSAEEQFSETEGAESSADDDNKTTMSNDNDPFDDAPEWAKALQEEAEKNSDRIDTLTEKVEDDDGDKDAWADAPEWAKAMRDEQKDLDERVENLAEAAGKSQQLSGNDGEEEDNSPSKADFLGIPGGDA